MPRPAASLLFVLVASLGHAAMIHVAGEAPAIQTGVDATGGGLDRGIHVSASTRIRGSFVPVEPATWTQINARF